MFDDLLQIAAKGLRKSRTLLSCHMGGLELRSGQVCRLREVLKIKKRDPVALDHIDFWSLQGVFNKERKIQSDNDFFASAVQK